MKPQILSTLPGYGGRALLSDLAAGVTVAMVAIPLSIAIAIASGGTPAQGLVTAVVAGFLISALGGSRVQVGGPTGAFIVVVHGVIATHGYDGLVLATLLAGVILLIAAVLRAGRLIAYVPEPVVNGFTIGIAVIIASSQIKDALGIELAEVPAEFLPKLAALWGARATILPQAVAVAAGTGLMIVVLRRLAPAFPGLIVAVAAGSAAALLFGWPVETIADRFGALPAGLPAPSLPRLDLAKVVEVLPSACLIAFLAAIESLLSAMVADRMIDDNHRPNAELMAQGAANIGSALFGGMPATGAIARTATNVRAGGRTPVAGMTHALVVLAVLSLAAPLAGMLALPALAALLMLTAWNMSEPHQWRGYLALPRTDLFLLLITMVLTVLADLAVAIAVGVVLGLLLRGARRVRSRRIRER
ncbi:sulfate permease, SulP family [Lutimaribacter pacificus]|uniref:Sulfate permease, SulP family n=1 Tax=Lutimaribacter pacificus TaxID=391948 RepID=A0A1H0A8X0_9RHOB|nr:SulP family inorganic anion transporter [Lutimaribacter pacificus]SDN29691.1 sulfate permease, SulP family [Lutimaribacter pacificus]SHJ72244.1 sulfate permease, SulP family [Lutimaribacter pacificus]